MLNIQWLISFKGFKVNFTCKLLRSIRLSLDSEANIIPLCLRFSYSLQSTLIYWVIAKKMKFISTLHTAIHREREHTVMLDYVTQTVTNAETRFYQYRLGIWISALSFFHKDYILLLTTMKYITFRLSGPTR